MKNFAAPFFFNTLLTTAIAAALWMASASLASAQTEVSAPGRGYRPIVLPAGYEHDRWETLPRDLMFEFAAFTTSFDSEDDNSGDGRPDRWGIPEWVAYEIKGGTGGEVHRDRPRHWLTCDSLHDAGIAPNDDTYRVRGANDMRVVKTDYRFVRGHMCPRQVAQRISADAAHNSHTVLNGVPQLQWQNNETWGALENDIVSWAERHGRVWVVCGPVFFGKNPAVWLGQEGNVRAAVPDALYKIVIRENGKNETGVETLAFIIPNVLPKGSPYAPFLTSIAEVERHTGLQFLQALPSAAQAKSKNMYKDLSEAAIQEILMEW